jgi:hypothetical protein
VHNEEQREPCDSTLKVIVIGGRCIEFEGKEGGKKCKPGERLHLLLMEITSFCL